MKKAQVDKNTCIGCGTCTMVAEKSFSLGDDGKAEFVDSSTGDPEEKLQEAIDSCPVQAISWIEEK